MQHCMQSRELLLVALLHACAPSPQQAILERSIEFFHAISVPIALIFVICLTQFDLKKQRPIQHINGPFQRVPQPRCHCPCCMLCKASQRAGGGPKSIAGAAAEGWTRELPMCTHVLQQDSHNAGPVLGMYTIITLKRKRSWAHSCCRQPACGSAMPAAGRQPQHATCT